MRLSGHIDYSGQPYFSCDRRFSRAFWGLRKGEDFWGPGPHRSSQGFTSQVLSQSGWFLKKSDNFGRAQLSSNLGTGLNQFLCFLHLCFVKIPWYLSVMTAAFFFHHDLFHLSSRFFVCKSITNLCSMSSQKINVHCLTCEKRIIFSIYIIIFSSQLSEELRACYNFHLQYQIFIYILNVSLTVAIWTAQKWHKTWLGTIFKVLYRKYKVQIYTWMVLISEGKWWPDRRPLILCTARLWPSSRSFCQPPRLWTGWVLDCKDYTTDG